MTAEDFLPEQTSLAALREAAAGCRGCELWQRATQTVFGAGLRRARVMLVGEIPGDEEDKQGRPFVGPAGRLLRESLAEAGIAAADAYLTNAVKHFSWEPRGKRRLHKRPSSRQIEACKPWLHAEILAIEPGVIVCLGAVAAQALLGRSFRLTKHRHRFVDNPWAPALLATFHPAAILRASDSAARRQMRGELVDDLRLAAARLT